jgi:hypothetical protein
MPYIVTTKRQQPTGHFERTIDPVSRRAVATLETVLQYGSDQGWRRAIVRAVASLPESGGTVGPLPDGTVIEVEQGPDEEQMLRDLREWAGMHYAPMGHDDVARLWCDAYNARQA